MAWSEALELVQAIRLWLQGDPEGRAADIPGLVDTMQLAPEELLSLVRSTPTDCKSGSVVAATDAPVEPLLIILL